MLTPPHSEASHFLVNIIFGIGRFLPSQFLLRNSTESSGAVPNDAVIGSCTSCSVKRYQQWEPVDSALGPVKEKSARGAAAHTRGDALKGKPCRRQGVPILVVSGSPSLVGSGDDFLDVTLLRCLFSGQRHAHGCFLNHLRYVDTPDTLFRLLRSAKLGASSQFQRVHKLVDVLFCRESSHGAIQVLAPNTAFSLAGKVFFEALCNLFNFFHGQRMDRALEGIH